MASSAQRVTVEARVYADRPACASKTGEEKEDKQKEETVQNKNQKPWHFDDLSSASVSERVEDYSDRDWVLIDLGNAFEMTPERRSEAIRTDLMGIGERPYSLSACMSCFHVVCLTSRKANMFSVDLGNAVELTPERRGAGWDRQYLGSAGDSLSAYVLFHVMLYFEFLVCMSSRLSL